MQVKGKDYEKLSQALVSAFNFYNLEMMLQYCLEQRLDMLVGRNDQIDVAVFRIIEKYNQLDQIEKLVQAARRYNPTNGDLHQVAQTLGRTTKASMRIGDNAIRLAGGELEKLVRRQVPKLSAQKMRNQMMQVEGQMCIIERRLVSKRGEALGSGFLIGSNVVLTSYHVVDSYLQGSQAQQLQVRFDALLNEEGVREPEEGSMFAVEEIPIASPHTQQDSANVNQTPSSDELDFALLLLADDAGRSHIGGAIDSGHTKVKRGWMKLPDPDPVFEVGDPLIIYQYPGGRELMMAIDTEAVIGPVWDGLRLRYRNNTEPGSSGSPVFNFDWQLVALHHAAAPGPEPVTYSQGIPIARIRAYLADKEKLFLLDA